jgi:hypothetical protein
MPQQRATSANNGLPQRFGTSPCLVFDTFRFVTSIAEQSRAKSFGHAERRQALTLAAIARRADIVSASSYSKRMVADGLVSKEKKCLWLVVSIKSVIILFELVFGCFTFLKNLKSRSFT